jgi:hypothetical protein
MRRVAPCALLAAVALLLLLASCSDDNPTAPP